MAIPLKVSSVNILTSNKNSLYTDSTLVEDALTVPVLYSKPLARVTPILVPLALPLVAVAVSNKSICLN